MRRLKFVGLALWLVFMGVGLAIGLLISDTEVGGVLGYLGGVVVYLVIIFALFLKLQRLADKQDTWRGMPLRSSGRSKPTT